MKNFFKKLIPQALLNFYYLSREYLAALKFGFPSRQLTVIGVTGTNGKTTVVELLVHLLNEAGRPAGAVSSLYFTTKKVKTVNKLKMTLPGRGILQGFIRQAVDAGVKYLILETTSEGIKQYRHRFIDYDGAVLTNLTPEHIEAHGSFDNYQAAKGELFKKVSQKRGSFCLVNLDDKQVDYFFQFPIDRKYGYSLRPARAQALKAEYRLQETFAPDWIQKTDSGFSLRLGSWELQVSLQGDFNLANSLAVIGLARILGLSWEEVHQGLDSFRGVPGRLEEIDEGQDFKVVVDYAHTPDALAKVYQTVSKIKDKGSKMIAVLGSAGGGRDRWKRPELGKLASQYADIIILTNEDPYDEDASQILSEIKSGILNSQFSISESNFYEILDRKAAIEKAIELAKAGDAVVITGKGAEPLMAVAGGRKIDWDDREIARSAIKAKRERSKQ